MMTLRKEIEEKVVKISWNNPGHYTMNEQVKMVKQTTSQICSLIKESLEKMRMEDDGHDWQMFEGGYNKCIDNLIKELE